jgi:hypothetical protein
LGKEGPSKEWVHIEYKDNRQIRTKEWIYTKKGNLIKVNQLGRPENRPEKKTDHPEIRKEMQGIFDQIPE